jgi:hypothetical protein
MLALDLTIYSYICQLDQCWLELAGLFTYEKGGANNDFFFVGRPSYYSLDQLALGIQFYYIYS